MTAYFDTKLTPTTGLSYKEPNDTFEYDANGDPVLYVVDTGIVDGKGDPVTDGTGDPIVYIERVQIFNEQGDPVLDVDGNLTYHEIGDPVLDADGNPTYDGTGDQLMYPAGSQVVILGTRYKSTDPLVSSWYKPLPAGLARRFDTDGFPVLLDDPAKSPLAIKKNSIVKDREAKEVAGVVWIDGGSAYYLPTDLTSQVKLTSARVAVEGNMRNGGTWKMGQVMPDGSVDIIYRETTNVEMKSITQTAHDYVQKCFDAEKVAIGKVVGFYDSGDFTAMDAVDYLTEFDALP